MDGISSDVSACVEGRVKKVNDQKAIPFASWKSRRVDAHPRQKKPSEVFFTRRRKRKDTYAPFSGARLIPYAFQSRKTANANVGKKVPARNARVIHAPHPSARSRPCPCPGGSAPRYPAPPRPPSRTLMLVTTAQPRRARLSRFRSFPASRGWRENGKRLVTDSAGRFLVRARGRGGAGWSLPAGTRARRWLDVVAARLASPERSNPEVATPRHEPGRVAGRPHSPREALKTTTRTRANE